MSEKRVTVCIPAFHAESTIRDCLSSIRCQTFRDRTCVIISSDSPEDDYSFILDEFKDLDIQILSCEKNLGPGLARQRALDKVTTPWVTFIDADDIFCTPFALEFLHKEAVQPHVMVMGPFVQDNGLNSDERIIINKNENRPWVFGRLYNVSYLRAMGIEFSSLRAMEDAEFNYKLRLSIVGTEFKIKTIDEPLYLWRHTEKPTITSIKYQGVYQYNYDLCPLGHVVATINACNFALAKDEFNPEVPKMILSTLANTYFVYLEAQAHARVFTEQILFCARYLYGVFKSRLNQISQRYFFDAYRSACLSHLNALEGTIPSITFVQFLLRVRTTSTTDFNELIKIREKLPAEVLHNDVLVGVFSA